jgi:hypothetical protein
MEIFRYAGLCEEATFAETPAPDAMFYIDEMAASLDAAQDSQIFYEGGRGRGINFSRPGYYKCGGDIEYAFDIRSIGFFLKWMLGGYAFTAGTLNRHELYGQDDSSLPSFCARLGKDRLDDDQNFEHGFMGCVIDSMEISVEADWTLCKMGIKAAKDFRADIKSNVEVSGLSAVEFPMVFHEVKVYRNNAEISANVKKLNLKIENNVNVDGGRSLGYRYARRLRAQARNITIGLDYFYEDIDVLKLLWGDDEGPSDSGPTEFPLVLTFAYVGGGQMDIIFPRFVHEKVPIQTSKRDEVNITAEGRALMDTVELNDESEVRTDIFVTLQNEQDDMALGGT